MLQSTSEYEERNFDDIQRALDIEHTVKALESQLCYDQHSPEEVARQILKAACKFYDADWCGLIQVDLDLKIWTPFWWYNDSSEDKTTILTEEFESAEFLDRWVQAVRHGKPMIVPDAEEVKNTYPAEYNLYQRLGIQSVLGASLEPRPVALLAVRNPKRYISETSILRLLAYVLLVAYKDKKMNDGLNMAFAPENIESSHDVFVSLFGELKIYTSHGILREADLKSPKISRLLTYLLISGKKAHSSLEIAQALWPDDSTNPAKNMRNLIYRLRQTFGLMTEREEALLFAQQTGISERLSAGQKLRALIFAGEPAAVAFQQATELAGVHLSFEEGRGKQRISCIATAYHEFIRLGPELYIESLDVLLNAWNGEPDSMSSANLLGICRFVELYHSEYNKGRLIAKLRQVDAFTIFRLARTAGVSLPGKTKYLQQVYTIYNGGSRRAALPLKF